MDAENTTTVEQRLSAACSGNQRLVYWQDEPGTYRDILGELDVPGATIVDATGAELATKRRVLRDEPHARFVVYRAGEEHGSARWATPRELRRLSDEARPDANILLTRNVRLAMSRDDHDPRWERNRNVVVIGGSGSGKTRTRPAPTSSPTSCR